jgi:hypothetical protein
MTEQTEQAFGLESVERKAGFVPATVDLPQDEPMGPDFEASHSDLAKGVQEIQQQKDQTQRERESRLVDAEIAITDVDGQKRPANETLSIDEAAYLVSGARNKDETTSDLDQRAALAAEIDAMRNGVTSEQLMAEPQPVFDQQPQPVQQPQLSDQDRMARALQENPQLLAGMQEVIAQHQAQALAAQQQYAQAIHQNALVAMAHVVNSFPEIAGISSVEEMNGALHAVKSRDPARHAAIVEHIHRTRQLVDESHRVQQAQNQQVMAQYQQYQQAQQQQFRAAAQQADARFEQWVKDEGLSAKERQAIHEEAWAILLEGGSQEQIQQAWSGNWALRNATSQITIAEAARARLARRGAKAKQYKPVPNVQRPGSPVERMADADVYLKTLEKPGKTLTAKEAAAFVTARRNARR